ncbi:pectin lyase fold/virulence factor [Fimicolochytrium jonesii]|uniref:pectin lyase fold/virulence factor n=1 Tax=Fimicolochytrium jonesii TaxID=1396493 RepID=UPI0022FE9251|nr:pectin lyase fold/virulence factor [Fimicolochytrium jonesii]KAI8821723.1 pectin lyase fold/virulence factor [Fimicolochytrium jonesii]
MVSITQTTLLALLCTSVGVSAVTNPPPGAFIVSKTPKGTTKTFPTVSSAIQALPADKPATLFIYPGVYREQVVINRKAPLTIIGYSRHDADYKSNQVLITYKQPASTVGSNDKSGTLQAHLKDFAVYNVNIRNEWVGSQAIAVSAQDDRQAYYGCQLLGYQDTLLTNAGHHFFGKTYIEGRTDYIFGQRSRAYFQKCDMRSLDKGWVTASGVDSAQNRGVYVFNQCTVAAAKKAVPTVKGGVFLGRPWRTFAHVLFMNSNLSDVVNPEGWARWRPTDPVENLQFYEYNNKGVGARKQKRAGFSRRLATKELSQYTITKVLNGTAWVDKRYM